MALSSVRGLCSSSCATVSIRLVPVPRLAARPARSQALVTCESARGVRQAACQRAGSGRWLCSSLCATDSIRHTPVPRLAARAAIAQPPCRMSVYVECLKLGYHLLIKPGTCIIREWITTAATTACRPHASAHLPGVPVSRRLSILL